ncbi:hypothetical protein O181_017189 [Austropuccinia psidii MF-1]|uniref:Uncharacterized protein n=1 Tax=Austropuccinia psidii MF-1 TaxID=1389203 RepID=A0A9Q3GSI9_9BASI|nr:hypothetical protein [Austropuccinia psidii MF-1]
MPPYQTQGMRGNILGMHNEGASIQNVYQKLGAPPTTFHNTIYQFKEHDHLDSLPIPVWPCNLNERDLQEFARVVQQNHCDTLVENACCQFFKKFLRQ